MAERRAGVKRVRGWVAAAAVAAGAMLWLPGAASADDYYWQTPNSLYDRGDWGAYDHHPEWLRGPYDDRVPLHRDWIRTEWDRDHPDRKGEIKRYTPDYLPPAYIIPPPLIRSRSTLSDW